jgi:hypothetical protein
MASHEGGCLCGKVRFHIAAAAKHRLLPLPHVPAQQRGAGRRVDDISGCEFFLDGRLARHVRVLPDGTAAVLRGVRKLYGLPE